jgi:hypothetical protein
MNLMKMGFQVSWDGTFSSEGVLEVEVVRELQVSN